jgi:hypothetical protein
LYCTGATIAWMVRLEAEWELRATMAAIGELGSCAIETIAREIAAVPALALRLEEACAGPVIQTAEVDRSKARALRLFLGAPPLRLPLHPRGQH